jgi:protein SCO1/2
MSAFHLRVLTLLSVVALVVTGCGGGDTAAPTVDGRDGTQSPGQGADAYRGAEVASRYAMPDVTLEDTEGQPFNLVTDTTDPITLVFFGYTHCPDVCDLVMSDLTVATSQLPAQVADQTEVLFVTTDPARDTPDAIRSYLDRYDPAFIGLTGTLDDIKQAAAAMQVAIEGRKQLPDGGYDVGHGAQVIGFVHDQAPVVWTEGTPYTSLVADITQLAGL